MLTSSLGISPWTPLKPQRSNPNLTLWPINSGVMTSLLLPHLSSSLTDFLPSLNLLCHSKTDARFMQDAPKAVWSIPYASVAFFSKFKTEFYCISFFQSVLTFRLHFWNSPAVTAGFSRVYYICCCSCSFEPEIIKIGQSYHKMSSNNILNFQESTAILNAHTKKVWKFIVCTSYLYIYIYIYTSVCMCVSVCVTGNFFFNAGWLTFILNQNGSCTCRLFINLSFFIFSDRFHVCIFFHSVYDGKYCISVKVTIICAEVFLYLY